jgi:protocatechuate 3,4-dioxygenase, beta subunit
MEQGARIILNKNHLYMKQYLLSIFFLAGIFILSCKEKTASSQKATPIIVGGGCEGCEAVYESPQPFEKLSYIDTLPGFFEPGAKLLVTGIVYQPDGKTPAPGVVIYLYHTGLNGLYQGKKNDTGWARRHGYHRGWLKTNERGEYHFYTVRPAPYPNATIPAHIHPTIKEQTFNEYYIDDFVFDDDSLLTKEERSKMPNRGGNGILKLQMNNGIFTAKRNIILGFNIPGYPPNK